MTVKTLKNVSGSDIEITRLGLVVPASEEISIAVQNHTLLASPLTIDEITPFVESEDLVINDGTEDLPSDVGLAHISSVQGVVREHNDITLLPAIGEAAPEIAKISNAVVGHCLLVGEEIFGQTRIDNLAGGDVIFQMHLTINNTVADRWIQYEVSYFTTTGFDEKACNTPDGTVTIGPVEVPTTAFGVFEAQCVIPASAWENGEKYMFLGVKRVTATGKTAPTNDPVTLRYCKEYFKKLGV